MERIFGCMYGGKLVEGHKEERVRKDMYCRDKMCTRRKIKV